jgi:hypothetical protein
LQAAQRAVDGDEFAVDLFHVRGARRALQAFAQQRQHFAIGAAALAGVLVQDHVVERRAQDARLPADVLVAPIAGAADDHRAARAGMFSTPGHQRRDGVRVVAVVGNHGGAG